MHALVKLLEMQFDSPLILFLYVVKHLEFQFVLLKFEHRNYWKCNSNSPLNFLLYVDSSFLLFLLLFLVGCRFKSNFKSNILDCLCVLLHMNFVSFCRQIHSSPH